MTATKRLLIALAAAFGTLVLLGLGVVALLAWAFSSSDFGSTFETASFETLDDWEGAAGFEESLGLSFPPSTVDVWIATEGFQDPLYQIRFTIDRDELPILESSIGCDGLLSQQASTPPQAVITEELDWWHPQTATTYRECSGGAAPGRVLEIFVDESAEATNEVYVAVVFL